MKISPMDYSGRSIYLHPYSRKAHLYLYTMLCRSDRGVLRDKKFEMKDNRLREARRTGGIWQESDGKNASSTRKEAIGRDGRQETR
jgi:hypothetical protein